MKKNEWPKVVRVGNARVTVYKRSSGTGYRLRYFDQTGKQVFESVLEEALAMQTAQRKAELLSTFGAQVAAVAPDEIARYVRATEILKPFNVDIELAARCLAVWLKEFHDVEKIGSVLFGAPASAKVEINSPFVAEAVNEFIAFKKDSGVGELHMMDMKTRLNTFAAKHVCRVHSLKGSDIQLYLDGLKTSAANYDHHRRILSVFFNWCVKRARYQTENIVLTTEKTGGKSNGHSNGNGDGHIEDILIYSPEEMAKIMRAAVDCKTVPMFALRGFCGGMRMTEFARLQWPAVDFHAGFAKLSASRAKTRNRRLAPLTDACRAWLEPHAKKSGFVWSDRDDDHGKVKSFPQILDLIKRAMRRTFEKAGVEQRDNGLRHSFCTYRLALLKDAAAVASEAGDSADIIHNHYKALSLPDGRLVTEELAKQYFAVKP